MSRFTRDADLPLQNLQAADLQTLAENIKPGSDFVDGTTLEVASDKIQFTTSVPQWRKYTITEADLTSGTNNHIETIVTIGKWEVLHALIVRRMQMFRGGGATAVSMNVGTSSDTNAFFNNMPMFWFVIGGTYALTKSLSNTVLDTQDVDIVADFTVTGAVASALTTGQVDIYLLVSELK